MIRLLLLALLTVPAWGQALSVGCTKATQGSTATCTGSGGTGPYTYSVSAGSGSIGSSSGVYTPPSTVEVKQKLGPCQLMPPDHIYNTRIDLLPAHDDSTTIIGRGGTNTAIRLEPSLPWNVVENSTPTFDAVFGYTPANNGAFRFLDWPLGKIQDGWFVTEYGVVDRHILSVNRETCEFSDVYNKYSAGANPNCPLCTSASGMKYQSYFPLPTSGASDAAGMAIPPVLLRLSDMQAGVIKHALRFTMGNAYIQSGVSTNFQWPALTGNSTPTCSAPCWKYGMYARLKSSVDISSFSPAAQVILTALKHYGMIMTDGGTNWAISASPDVFLDKDTRAAIAEIFYSSLRNSDFEVPDTSAMDITSSSGAVNLSNGYVTPSQYAEVTVTDSAMNTATTRVNLGGIAVGVAEPTMTIMAGHTVTPVWWVTGTATQTVTWTMDPDVGTLNSSTGEFTPDSGVTSPTRTRLTATSTVEATATAVIDVVVWPDNASGNIYADWGRGDTASKTHDSKTFWPDEWVQFEGWSGTSGYGIGGGTIYTNARYSPYSDMVAKWYLPNGNYKARIYVKTDQSSGTIQPQQYKVHYESQGQLIYRNFSIGRATGVSWNHANGGYIDLPMKVTDGSGRLAFRHLTGELNTVFISAVGIEADASDPYISIDDPTSGADITISQTRQFYAIGWYMSNSVTWSVQSGPGAIDEDGLYTAPSTPPSSPQTVTIRATSTVDGMIYAETTFDFIFGTITVTGPTSISRGQTAQFTAAIGGVSYTNVTWSRSGAQGSINFSGLYSSPGSITDGTITITATPTDMGGSAGTADLDLIQLIDPIRVDAAWNGLTENGRVWAADPGPCTRTGATTFANSNGGTVSVAIPEQETLYDTPRFTTGSGTWGYACPVPSGIYQITLKMANNNAVDAKVKMHVDAEGVRKLTDFELTVEAGGVLIGVDRTFTAVVTDGVLNIEFVGVSNPPSQTKWTSIGAFEALDLGPIVGQAIISGGVTITGGVVVQ